MLRKVWRPLWGAERCAAEVWLEPDAQARKFAAMNRRGFLWAVGAAGLALVARRPVVAAEASRDPTGEKSETAQNENAEALIRRAIREQRVLTFRYNNFARTVEPHAFGVATEDRLAVLSWQFAGGSESEPPPGWRLFFVAEMEALAVQAGKFTRRPSYDPTKTKLKMVLAEVARE